MHSLSELYIEIVLKSWTVISIPERPAQRGDTGDQSLGSGSPHKTRRVPVSLGSINPVCRPS